MLLRTIQWVAIGLVSSYVISSIKYPPVTLGSLSENPSDFYSSDFYPNGTNLELPLGTMRYWQFGNQDGNRVVLVHGISTGSAVYDKLARDLANNGHHVLVFDLWGRGYSQAPFTVYDESLYTTQLAMLLQKVGWSNADVIGVSLGGGIATSFTAFYPEMVNNLVLIAPTGLMHTTDMPLVSKIVKLPFVYPFIMTTQSFIRPMLLNAIQRFATSTRVTQAGGGGSEMDKDTAKFVSKIIKIANYQFMHHPGFFRAFLGTVVNFPFTKLHMRYEKVGQEENRSILLIWGDKDLTVPFYHHKEAQTLLPKAKLIVYENQGHDVLITGWRSVNQEIKTFLL